MPRSSFTTTASCRPPTHWCAAIAPVRWCSRRDLCSSAGVWMTGARPATPTSAFSVSCAMPSGSWRRRPLAEQVADTYELQRDGRQLELELLDGQLVGPEEGGPRGMLGEPGDERERGVVAE